MTKKNSDLSRRITDLSPEKLALLLSNLTKKREAATLSPIVWQKRGPDTFFPLSFTQQRLWFLDQLTPNNPAYNISGAVRLLGEWNVTALEESLNRIVSRHESLRTSFVGRDGEAVQIIAESLRLKLILIDLG